MQTLTRELVPDSGLDPDRFFGLRVRSQTIGCGSSESVVVWASKEELRKEATSLSVLTDYVKGHYKSVYANRSCQRIGRADHVMGISGQKVGNVEKPDSEEASLKDASWSEKFTGCHHPFGPN